MSFPAGFYWGAATASYQVEGFNENTDWAKAAKEGRVPPAGRLADQYHRYEEDFDIAKELGHNAHRFSIEWARIEPREGEFDEKEIEHYRKVLKALKKRNITPFVTLWHFTLPLWFSESGGFERKDAPEIFARYCAKVVEELGDLCDHFATINEPNVYATHGWLYGVWPPFKRAAISSAGAEKGDGTTLKAKPNSSLGHLLLYFRVAKQLARAHNCAYLRIKTVQPETKVSVVKHVRVFTANWNPINQLKASIMRYLQTGMFMNRVSQHLDEIGLNYYQWTGYGQNLSVDTTDMGWYIRPEGIYHALRQLHQYKKPVYIAEAGLADEQDEYRADYIQHQIGAVQKAVQEGIDVRGHMYWSLIDNYEWALGVQKKFGLVEIDYKTLERKIRPSAWVYKELIETHSVK